MASLHRRDNGRWKVAYRDPGGRQRAKTFRTKREAERFRVHIEEAIERGSWRDPNDGKRTIGSLAEVWFHEKQAETKPGTWLNYQSILNRHVLPTFGEVEVGRVTPTSIRHWVANLRKGNVGAVTVAKAFRIVASILELAVEDGLIPASPVPTKNRPTTPQTPEQRFLTLEEIDALADVIDPHYRRWLYVLVHTGIRWSEAAGLRVRRVDLLRRRVDVAEQLVDVRGHLVWQTPKTERGRRAVTVPRFIADMLAEDMAGKRPDDLVFATRSGTPLRKANFRKRMWLPALAKAGLDGLRVHDLRHTHVALLIDQGEKPLAIAKRLGHGDAAFTLTRYGHLMHDEDEAIADRMESLAPTSPRPASTVVPIASR